jgi:hypothetical protein
LVAGTGCGIGAGNRTVGVVLLPLCQHVACLVRPGGLTVFGFGSFGTLWQLYNSDPLMAWLTPTVLRWTLQGRILRAGVLASIGVFAKEFAIVPLAIAGITDALEHHWRRAFRAIAAGIVGFLIWVGLQVFLRTRYGYVFGDNMSPKLFEGSYLVYWLRELGPTTALLSMSNEFGPVWILFPVGWLAAPRPLRRIVIASIPIALFLAYVQQPDRSFWNFHFVIMPLAALVLEPMPDLFVWSFLAVYALAYLRTGAEISFAPPSRYAFAVGLVMAVVAGVTFVRTQRSTAASGAAS